MDKKLANHDRWDACPPGELQRMVHWIKVRRRRQVLKQFGSAAAGVAVLGVGGYLASQWLRGPTEYNYGGIACSQVMPLLPDYYAKRLNAELTRRIAIHLDKCPNCGPAYRRMIAEMDGMAHTYRTGGIDRMHRRGRTTAS